MINEIIAKLQSLEESPGRPLFAQVGDALDAGLIKDQTRGRASAYVVPLNETAEPNSRITGPVLQRITEAVGIVIVVQTRNDRTGGQARDKLKPYRLAARLALLGFQPTADHSVLTFVSGELLEMDAGAVIWLDTYQTDELIEGV